MTPVLAAALAVAAGTGLGHGRGSLALVATFIAIKSIVAAIALHRRETIAFALAIVALMSGACASASWRTAATNDAVVPRLVDDGGVDLCGDVRTPRFNSVEMTVTSVRGARRTWTTREPVRMTADDLERLRPGKRVCATGEVHPPRRGREEPPLFVADKVRIVGTGSAVRAAADAVRVRFSEAAHRVLPKTQAGLLLGMTEGDVASLDDKTMDAFRTTGLAHLVAVSGSNVAVVLVVLMLVARALVRRSRWLRVAICLPGLVFFAFLTGLEASVLRACVTAAIALVITAEGRPVDGMRIAALSFVVLVLASPELMLHPGFQLSFAATLGLIVWAKPLTDRIAGRLPSHPAWTAVAVCVATTLAAQAAAAPFLAWHFGRVPAVGGLANLLVAPLAPVVMIGGVATLMAASWLDALSWAPLLMRLPLDLVLWCGWTFAELPSASVGASIAVGVALTAAMAAFLAGSVRARRVFFGLAVVSGTIAGGGAIAGTSSCDGAGIVALDVGQGTAVLLRADGHAVLVDGGPDDGGVVADLDAQGVRELDAVFVSHPHADHVDGLVDVVERLDVGTVIAPATVGWGMGGALVRAAREAGVPIAVTEAGETYDFGPLDIEIVSPDSADEPLKTEEAVHEFSLVLLATVDGARVILPGDVGAEEERALLDADIDADVFIAPHHGSKDLDPEFVDAISPRMTLVSVGADNRYGHPAPEAVRAYARHGPVFRTDRDGTITACVDGSSIEVSKQR